MVKPRFDGSNNGKCWSNFIQHCWTQLANSFYGVGCCWIKFDLACPQTYSLFIFSRIRQRAPVASFPRLHPQPLALAYNKSPAVFISIHALDDLQRGNRGSVYRLGLSEFKLVCDGPWIKQRHFISVSHLRKIISSEYKLPMQHIGQF